MPELPEVETERGRLAARVEGRRIRAARIDVAHPGESARIINVHDVLEPRLKDDGPGQTYPGVCGRDVATVGSGENTPWSAAPRRQPLDGSP